MLVDLVQSLESLIRTQRPTFMNKKEFFLPICLQTGTMAFSCLQAGTQISTFPDLELVHLLTCWTRTTPSALLVLRSSDLDQNYTSALPVSILLIHSTDLGMYIHMYRHIHVPSILLVLLLWRTLTNTDLLKFTTSGQVVLSYTSLKLTRSHQHRLFQKHYRRLTCPVHHALLFQDTTSGPGDMDLTSCYCLTNHYSKIKSSKERKRDLSLPFPRVWWKCPPWSVRKVGSSRSLIIASISIVMFPPWEYLKL